MPNLPKFGTRIEVKYDVILHCLFGQDTKRNQTQARNTPVLLRMEDAFEACNSQYLAVPVFLVLYHQKVGIDSRRAGRYSCEIADKPLQQ